MNASFFCALRWQTFRDQRSNKNSSQPWDTLPSYRHFSPSSINAVCADYSASLSATSAEQTSCNKSKHAHRFGMLVALL